MTLKPNCACCDQDLPADSAEAVLCSAGSTYCRRCAETLLAHRCPGCGGELARRPRPPAAETATLGERQRCHARAREIVEQAQVLRTATGELHGSLLLPPDKPAAWVLLIAGSGAVDRDGNSAGQPYRHHCLRYLALELAAQGIASLRYDKRGVGASAAAGRSEAALTFDRYVEDAKAWLAHLRLRASGPVSVLGHSEGAQIATRVAETLSVASVVNLCGAGRALDVLLLEQLEPQLPPALYQQAQHILEHLHQLSLEASRRRAGKPKLLQRLGHAAPPKAPTIPPELHALFKPSKHPYYLSRLRECPDRELETLRCPVLIVSGGADIQVGLEDYQRLTGAKPDAQAERIAGMNHLLKPVGDDPELQHRSYVDPALPIDAVLVARLVAFLRGPKS